MKFSVVSGIGGVVVDGKPYPPNKSSGSRPSSVGSSPQSQGPYHPPIVPVTPTTPTGLINPVNHQVTKQHIIN